MDLDLEEELQSYLDQVIEDKTMADVPPRQARREARIELGGREQVKERVRDRRIGAGVDRLWQDLRYGVRTLRRSPLFTLAAVLSLATGIGANTAVFTFLYGFYIRPMPWPDAGRLMSITTAVPELGIERDPLTYREFEYFRENARSFDDIAARELTDLTLIGAEEPLRMFASRVSDNNFAVLGLAPALGRDFLPSDSRPGAESVVMLGGLGTAFVLLRRAESFFFGVSPTDPAIYLLSTLSMGTITLLATFVPALRATRIDPARTLRVE